MDNLHSTAQIKKMNTELIRTALKNEESVTKLSLAKTTGLSLATCGTILNELTKSGEVTEDATDKTNGGRPALRYALNANFSLFLCFYAKLSKGGRESLRYGVVNLKGGVIAEGELSPGKINYESVEDFIAGIIKKYGSVRAIGIGVPGVLKDGAVSVCDIEGLSGLTLARRLTEKFGLKVLIENDMNLTVYGFCRESARENGTLAFVYFPDDFYPGAGIIVNGQVLKGFSNFAGEVSYLTQNRGELLKSFGNPEALLPIAARIIASVVCVINPVRIILASDILRRDDLTPLLSLCRAYIPMGHMAEIEIRSSDIHREYMRGIVKMTMDAMAYPPRYI